MSLGPAPPLAVRSRAALWLCSAAAQHVWPIWTHPATRAGASLARIRTRTFVLVMHIASRDILCEFASSKTARIHDDRMIQAGLVIRVACATTNLVQVMVHFHDSNIGLNTPPLGVCIINNIDPLSHVALHKPWCDT